MLLYNRSLSLAQHRFSAFAVSQGVVEYGGLEKVDVELGDGMRSYAGERADAVRRHRCTQRITRVDYVPGQLAESTSSSGCRVVCRDYCGRVFFRGNRSLSPANVYDRALVARNPSSLCSSSQVVGNARSRGRNCRASRRPLRAGFQLVSHHAYCS